MGATDSVSFSVPVVFGWQRAGYDRRSGRHYEKRRTAEVKAAVRAAFLDALPEGTTLPLFGPHVPVTVAVDTYRLLPPSRPKRTVAEADTYKPDIDNITKLVLDALSGAAYADDAQVVELRVSKRPRARYAGEHTNIYVSRGWEPSPRAKGEADGRG